MNQEHGFAKYLTRRSQREISKNPRFPRSFVDIRRGKALVHRLRVMRLIKRRIIRMLNTLCPKVVYKVASYLYAGGNVVDVFFVVHEINAIFYEYCKQM